MRTHKRRGGSRISAGSSTGDQRTFSNFAAQSRRIWYGGVIFAAGLILLAFVANDALHGEPYTASARFLTLEASTLLLLGAASVAWGVQQVRCWIRLYERAQETEAIITKVKQSLFQSYMGRRLYFKKPKFAACIVHYQYQDHLGTTRRGRSGYLISGPGSVFKTGDRIRIRFDLEDPSKSMCET